MEPRLGGLRDRIEEFLQERGEVHRDHARGSSQAPPLQRLFHGYPELTRVDTFHEVREALAGQPKDSEGHRRLSRLCGLLSQVAIEARSAEADERRAVWESTATPWPDEPGLTWIDATRRVPREANRGRRALLARALVRDLEGQERLYARRIDAVHEVAERLEFPSALALYEAFAETRFSELAADAQALLSRTEDAYRDLLGYVLRKADPALKHSAAEWHDLEHALVAPWTYADTAATDLAHASRRWIEDWNVAAGAGRLELDLVERAGKSAAPSIVAVRVPDRVFVTARTEAGIADSLTMLRSQGAGLSVALRDRRLPLEERRLAHARTQEAFAALFARMWMEPRWLERYLRVSRSQARELARLSAFAEVAHLRRAAARLSYELELVRRGPGAELRDVYEDLFRKALGVSVPRAAFLHGLSAHLGVASLLEGGAIAAALLPKLRERFDEDFWRNPNAAAFLRNVAAQGGSEEAWAAVLPNALQSKAAEAASELVAVMGA